MGLRGMKCGTLLLSGYLLLLAPAPAALGQQPADWPQPDPSALGGPDFTPLGAERAGNQAGTIPPWSGGLSEPPAGYRPGRHEVDPFPEDRPLFTVTVANLEQHAGIVSPGQRALLQAYPASWRMPVYPSRRTAAYPEWVYEGVMANGRRLDPHKVEADELSQARIGSPFPIPANGEQVVWNHNLRWRGLRLQRALARAAVTRRGKYTVTLAEVDIGFPYGSPGENAFTRQYPNLLLAIRSKTTAPSLLANNASVTLEPIDHRVTPRATWEYLQRFRRVIRQPYLGYEQPAPNTDNLRTVDDFELFNGATDRFEWTLLGKREMLIPYNAYRLHGEQLGYDDILQVGHINPEHARYELHRVWVVEGRLKKDARHVYSRRVFYLDEDTWQIGVSESYDKDGSLWRVSEAHALNFYTLPVTLATLYVYHDLKEGRYVVDGLDNKQPPYRFLDYADPREFSPNSLLYYVR
jgi:hypothetical protein